MRLRVWVGAAVAASVLLVGCGPKEEKKASPHPVTEPSREPSAEESTAEPTDDPTDDPAAEPTTGPSKKPSKKPPVAGKGTPKTKEGAIGRYETYLRAIGEEDVETLCDVAGPAAEEAEEEGFGPCTTTFPMMFQMVSPEQKAALRAATVDPGGVTEPAPGSVTIPPDAIRASVTFSNSDLGTSTLKYIGDNWYVME